MRHCTIEIVVTCRKYKIRPYNILKFTDYSNKKTHCLSIIRTTQLMLRRKIIFAKYRLVFCHGRCAQSEEGGSLYRHEHQGLAMMHGN